MLRWIHESADVRGHRGGLAYRASLSETNTDRKSTRLNSSHGYISYAVFCLKKKKTRPTTTEAHRHIHEKDTTEAIVVMTVLDTMRQVLGYLSTGDSSNRTKESTTVVLYMRS